MSTGTSRCRSRRSLTLALGLWVGALLLPLSSTSSAVDLDDLTAQELDAALDAELGADDLWQFGIDVKKAYPLEVLHEAILGALSDEGDDASEQVLTEADLQEEMDEAGTDLGTVIWSALQQADQVASGRPVAYYLRVAADILARRDGLTIGGVGATQSKLAVRATIEKRK